MHADIMLYIYLQDTHLFQSFVSTLALIRRNLVSEARLDD
jgi:hypothetical protein